MSHKFRTEKKKIFLRFLEGSIAILPELHGVLPEPRPARDELRAERIAVDVYRTDLTKISEFPVDSAL